MDFFQGIASALTPAGLIWTLLIITAATFLHELAHYALARRQGVKFNSFSIGMGPCWPGDVARHRVALECAAIRRLR